MLCKSLCNFCTISTLSGRFLHFRADFAPVRFCVLGLSTAKLHRNGRRRNLGHSARLRARFSVERMRGKRRGILFHFRGCSRSESFRELRGNFPVVSAGKRRRNNPRTALKFRRIADRRITELLRTHTPRTHYPRKIPRVWLAALCTHSRTTHARITTGANPARLMALHTPPGGALAPEAHTRGAKFRGLMAETPGAQKKTPAISTGGKFRSLLTVHECRTLQVAHLSGLSCRLCPDI